MRLETPPPVDLMNLEAHDALAEYQIIFDNAIVGIVYTRDRKIARCNRRFEEMFCYGPGELDGCDVRRLYPSEEDYERIGQRGYQILIRHNNYSDERVMLRKNGEQFWCGVSGRALDKSHPFQDAVWIFIDISKRKRAEEALRLAHEELERRVQERTRELRETNEALRAEMEIRRDVEQELVASREKYKVLFETFPIGISITDEQNNVIEINRALRKFSTLASMAEITRELKSSSLSLIDSDGEPFKRERLPSLRALREQRTIGDVEVGIRYANGKLRWFNVAAAPIPVAGYGAVVAHTEITERKRFEEKERHQQSELARVSRVNTMGEMAAALAHELGQPLVSTLNYLHGCKIRLDAEEFDPALFRTAIDQATQYAEQAADIVRHVRQFVRRHEPETVETDLNSLISQMVSFLDFERRQFRVPIRLSLDQTLPHLPLEPVEIKQVVVNLIRNAFEAMSTTPVTDRLLEISTGRDGKRWVTVGVSDRGSGISRKDASKIFNPFFTTKRNGMGLGLAVCQSVVQSHGGEISVGKNPYGGAAFRIMLPTGK